MGDNVAVIRVNNIEVGSMPVEQYESIVEEVKKDRRIRVASAFSYAGIVCKLTCRFWFYFVQSLAGFIVIGMLYSLFYTAEVTQMFNEIKNQPPENVVYLLRQITEACLLFSLLAYMVGFLISGVPSFSSATQNAINRKIRELMEVPAHGRIKVEYKKSGISCVR